MVDSLEVSFTWLYSQLAGTGVRRYKDGWEMRRVTRTPVTVTTPAHHHHALLRKLSLDEFNSNKFEIHSIFSQVFDASWPQDVITVSRTFTVRWLMVTWSPWRRLFNSTQQKNIKRNKQDRDWHSSPWPPSPRRCSSPCWPPPWPRPRSCPTSTWRSRPSPTSTRRSPPSRTSTSSPPSRQRRSDRSGGKPSKIHVIPRSKNI